MAEYNYGNVKVVDVEGGVEITRPSMITKQVHTLKIEQVNALQVISWITDRATGNRPPMVQDAFPHLNANQREFLMTGIPQDEWDQYMKDEEDEKGD